MASPRTVTLAECEGLIASSRGGWDHVEFKKSTGELHGGIETRARKRIRNMQST